MPSTNNSVNNEAKALSKLGAKKGGEARAASLSPNDRKAIARRAAEARWGKTVLQASHTGELIVGDKSLQCAVVEGEIRVINQWTLLRALGRSGRTAGTRTDNPVFAPNLQGYVPQRLADALASPITYTAVAGGKQIGYKAELLPDICWVYLDAWKDGGLRKNQYSAATAADVLIRGLSKVGIVALVDEATGYQDVRTRHALEELLHMYVAEEMRPWIKMFPNDFFKETYRLNGWNYNPSSNKRTPLVGTWTNKYIYEPLPSGVLEELRRRNPRNENGNRSYRHHQFLTESTGNVHLDRQISTVTTLMKISNSKAHFQEMFNRAFPPPVEQLPLIVDVTDVRDDTD